jgi:SAM-dependent methyltransferase
MTAEARVSDPVVSDTAAIDPVGIDPVGIDPVGIDPVGIDPVGIDPVAIDPAAMGPVASDTRTEAPFEGDLPVPHRCPWPVQYFLLNPLRRLVENPEKLLQPYVRPGMQVLEPGCGMGYFSLALARMVGPEGRVLCLDIEPRAVRRLERRARKAGLDDRIIARACEPRDLGLDDCAGRIDRVVLMHTLHEIEALPEFFRQVRELLASGGLVFVVEPRSHVRPGQFEAMMACGRRNGLRVLERPDLGGKRLAAVLARA